MRSLVTATGVPADVDDEVVRRAERLRSAGYRPRRGDDLREDMNPDTAVMAKITPEGVDPVRIVAAIRRHARQDDAPGRQLP